MVNTSQLRGSGGAAASDACERSTRRRRRVEVVGEVGEGGEYSRRTTTSEPGDVLTRRWCFPGGLSKAAGVDRRAVKVLFVNG